MSAKALINCKAPKKEKKNSKKLTPTIDMEILVLHSRSKR